MSRWHHECCHWYFVFFVLPLSYLVTFLNHGFQFVTELRQVKIKILEVFVLVFFHHSEAESLFWDYLFHLPEKYCLLHLQISMEEMTIVCGF